MSFTVTDEPVYIDLTLSENKEEVNGLFLREFVFGLHKYYFLKSGFWWFDDSGKRENKIKILDYSK